MDSEWDRVSLKHLFRGKGEMMKYKGAIFSIVLLIFTVIIISLLSKVENTTNVADGKGQETITVWAWGGWAQHLEDIAPIFEERNPGININVNNQGVEQVYQRLTTGLASGQSSQLPDIVQMEEQRLPIYNNNFPNSFVDLTEFGFDQYAEVLPEAKVGALSNEEGNLIGLPGDIGPVGLFYRIDVFEDANVDPQSIKTWDDYIDAGKTIKEVTGIDMLGFMANDDISLYKILLQQQGSFYFNEDGKITTESKESKKAFLLMNELFHSGIAANVTNWDGRIASLQNNQVATVPGAVWWSRSLMQQVTNSKGNWRVMKLPEFKEGNTHAAADGGSNFVIPKASDNQRIAYEFIKFATTDLESLTSLVENYFMFPAYTPLYEEEIFKEGNAYFGNQKVLQLFAEISEEVPKVNYTSDYLRANITYSDELASMMLQNKSPEEAWQSVLKKLQSSTGRESSEED